MTGVADGLSALPGVPPFGDQPTPASVDVVGLDLPVGRLTAYRALGADTSEHARPSDAVVPAGAGGTVLVVPGWTGSKEDFRTFLPLLQRRGWTVVVISRRGQGDSVGPSDPNEYRLDVEAADVIRVARIIDDGRPVHLIGHSLGGVIARAAAIAAPGAFRSLTMLCSGPRGWEHRDRRQRAALRRGGQAVVDRWFPETVGVPDDDLPEALRFLRMRMLRSAPESLRQGAEILETAADTTDALAATALPVLVAHGEFDDAWPIPWQRDMAERLGAQYAVIPGGHHSPQLDAADGTAMVLDTFLASVPTR